MEANEKTPPPAMTSTKVGVDPKAMKLPQVAMPGAVVIVRPTTEFPITDEKGAHIGTTTPGSQVIFMAMPKEPSKPGQLPSEVEVVWRGEVAAPFGAKVP